MDELYPTLEEEVEKIEYQVIEPASPLNFDDSPIRIPLEQKKDIEGSPKYLKSQAFATFLNDQVQFGHKL